MDSTRKEGISKGGLEAFSDGGIAYLLSHLILWNYCNVRAMYFQPMNFEFDSNENVI